MECFPDVEAVVDFLIGSFSSLRGIQFSIPALGPRAEAQDGR
jgi:hypothetical protein